MIDLDAIEARCAAATPGPWRQCGADRKGCACGMVWSEPADFVVAQGEKGERAGGFCGFDVDDETISTNMRFVAHARSDVPALLAEVRRLTARLALAQASLIDNCEWHGSICDEFDNSGGEYCEGECQPCAIMQRMNKALDGYKP